MKKPKTKSIYCMIPFYMNSGTELKTVVFMVWGLGRVLTGKGQKAASGCQKYLVFGLGGGYMLITCTLLYII